MSADVIVVLGAALGPEGDLGPLLAERVLAGVEAWRAGRAPMLLMTGKCEAELMRRRALKLGVPAERVLVETAALTTRENATGCAAVLRAHGMARALVVTQAFHRARAVAAFRRVGVDAEPLAFADMGVSVRTRARELIARVAYRARGWI
ncbi:MAG TPA: YdcF family protein [Polyangia bacterium]|nr:YdcF family protein [Polyangia bacterium]